MMHDSEDPEMSSDTTRRSECNNNVNINDADAPDYYWRDYTGKIPRDAIPGGKDINNQITYVGQAYYHRNGILVGMIYPGKPAIGMSYNGKTTQSTTGAKILCSLNPRRFSWIQAQSHNLHLVTVNETLVMGGYEDDKIINVGRVQYQGELVVGKVLGFEIEKAKLCFVHGEKEIDVNSYEVLIYTSANK